MKQRPTRPRRRERVGLVILLVALLAVGPTAAWGLWSDRATLETQVSAGVVEPPTGLACDRVSGGLLQTAARVSWEAADDVSVTYRVLIDDGQEVTEVPVMPGETRIDLSRGLLGNLIGGLLDLLLGGGVVDVSVVAVHDSGWISPPTSSVQVTGGLLGVYCA